MSNMTDLLLEIQEFVQTNRIFPNCPLKAEVDSPSNHYDFLYEFCRRTQPTRVAELGTHFGVSTAYIHRGCPTAEIWTVDNDLIKSPNIAKHAKNLPNTTFILGEAAEVAAQIPGDLDFIFIDEEKDVPNLEADLRLYYPKVKAGGCLFFDDILGANYYPEAYKWWRELQGYSQLDLPKVHHNYAWGVILK